MMSTSPPPLEYASSGRQLHKPGGVRWLLLVLSAASLFAAVCMMPATLQSHGWDQFALAIIDRVLLVPQFIVLGAAAWYAKAANRRTGVVTASVALAAIALLINLITVLMTLG